MKVTLDFYLIVCYNTIQKGAIMADKDENKKELTPFGKARYNVEKAAENFNFYNSVEMLAMAIVNLNKVEGGLGDDELKIMCENIMKELSATLFERDGTWN
jgi:hypothetical protein